MLLFLKGVLTPTKFLRFVSTAVEYLIRPVTRNRTFVQVQSSTPTKFSAKNTNLQCATRAGSQTSPLTELAVDLP